MIRQAVSILTILITAAALPVEAMESVKRLPLPPEADEKQKAAMMDLLRLGQPLQGRISASRIIDLDSSYNEGLSLRDALLNALNYNLAIKISKENWNYQRYQLLATMAGFVPTYSASLSYTKTHVKPITNAKAQLFISEVKYPAFLGGSIFFNIMAQYYRNLAWKRANQSTISDKLLEVFKLYNNLCLQDVLLQIQSKSVQLADHFLQLDQERYERGLSTQYNIVKSRNQFFSEREALSKQEASRRDAALALAFALNIPLAGDLQARDRLLKTNGLFSKQLTIDQCLNLAQKNRPELRQYEYFRLAAARSVQAAVASLYPQLTFFTTFTQADVTVVPSNNGGELNGEAQAEVASAEETEGNVVTNTALNQTASSSPEKNNTGTEGANTFATQVAGGGGTPIANVQGGSLVTSGAVAPLFGASSTTGRSSSSNIDGANTAGAGVFPGVSRNFQKGLNLEWDLSNMGLSTAGNVLSARSLSRQSMLQANQELQLVRKDVCTSYTQLKSLEQQLDNAAATTASAADALRFAFARVKAGVGNKLEIIYARRDYISALSTQAQIVADYNNAQAQLLHDMGLVSVDSLSSGMKDEAFEKNRKRRFLEW